MKNFKQFILSLFFKHQYLGLKPIDDDDRDIVGWKLFGTDYKPKFNEKKLDNPYEAKNQNFNTCGWVSTAGAKQIDEKFLLDERTLIIIAEKEGLISGDGFSNLRDNEKILQKYGIAEKGLLNTPFKNWAEYSDKKLLTKEILDNALKHRSGVYMRLYNISEIYKAIDDGRYIKIGIGWRSAFNMGGGFSFPYILNFVLGILIGGHAMYIYGYNQNYYGKKVFLVRNSFGKLYGLNGDLYITEGDMQNEMSKYGAFRNEDMELDIAKFLNEYDGKNVKCKESPTVYHIQNGKKKPYLHEIDYFVWNIDKDKIEFEIVEKEVLDKVEQGDNMDITKSTYWGILKHLEQPLNLTRILEAIKQYKNGN